MKGISSRRHLPEIFRPLLWSYRFEDIDMDKHKREIVVSAINYGDLIHWRWVIARYGLEEVRHILTTVPVTEIRHRVLRLVSALLGISAEEFNYTPRGPH